MSKLREAWVKYNNSDGGEEFYADLEMERAITETEAELARLTRERDEARNKTLDEAVSKIKAVKNYMVIQGEYSEIADLDLLVDTASAAILALKTKDQTNG